MIRHLVVIVMMGTLAIAYEAVISHASVSRPNQGQYSYGVEHGHRFSAPWKKAEVRQDSKRNEERSQNSDGEMAAAESRSDFVSHTSINKLEGGAWSHVAVKIGHRQEPTSYASFNLYS